MVLNWRQWLRKRRPRSARRRATGVRYRPCLQTLEDRTVLSFAYPLSLPTSANPSSLAGGDFNRDGTLDFAVANRGQGAGQQRGQGPGGEG